MENKETGTNDELTGKAARKDMEQENMIVPLNPSLLDVWNDYIETNKRLYQLKEEELNINSKSGDAHQKMISFLAW